MDKLFRKLTFRTIKSNIKQFLSVILIVFLGVTLLSGFITNSHMLKKSIDGYFAETKLAKTWLYVDSVSEADEVFFNGSYFQDNKIEYDKRLYIETNANVTEKSISNNAKIFVSDGKISTPYIESGKAGCMIDKKVAKNSGIDVTFDTLSFTVPYNYMGIDLEFTLEFNISGTMSFDECADTYSSWPVFIDEDLFLAELNNKIQLKIKELLGDDSTFKFSLDAVPYNQILLTADDSETISKINAYYDTSATKLIAIQNREQVESVVLLNSEVKQSRRMIYVFPVIFMIVSILVILTTIDQLVLQEKQKIGTLKSIGIPDRKILRHYTKFGALLCLIGALIGTLVGIFLIPRIMFIKYNLVYSIPDDYVKLKVPFWWVLLVLAAVVILGYLVSLFSCYQILHKKPIECLRFDVGGNSKAFKKNKGRFKKVPLSVKMATRNIRLKPARTLMATIGIAGCVALLLCGFGIGNTLDNCLANDFERTFSYDVTTTYKTENFEEELQKVDGIEAYELYDKFYADASFGSGHKETNIFSVKENSAFTSFKLSAGEAFVSKSVADELGAKEGDEITLSLGDAEEKFKITKIGETSIINGIFVAKVLSFNDTSATHSAWIKCTNSSEVAKQINKINGTNDAKTIEETIDSAESKISSIDLMTNTLKFFAIMLAVIVLLNLIFLILKERTRELATLKVLGKDMFSITLSIYFEVLFMVIIGLIIGMLLGYPLLILVLTVNKVEIVNFIYYVSPLSYVFTCLIVLLTQIIMTAFSFWKVKKINMIESLKSVE